MQKISAYIIAFNEEKNIANAIRSVLWADEVLIADSGSTDRTVEIAESLGARVVQIDFEGFGPLRNKAIAACSHEWIFSLDSDERCTEEAREEIQRIIQSPDAADAYLVPRKSYFMGRWVKGCGWYPDYRQTQLFRKGALLYTDEVVHESFITEGRVATMQSHVIQFPFRNYAQLLDKTQRYSTLGAQKMASTGKTASMAGALLHGMAAFIRLYVFKRGFMDGWAGFMIAFGNFEGTFWRYAKRYELQQDWEKMI